MKHTSNARQVGGKDALNLLDRWSVVFTKRRTVNVRRVGSVHKETRNERTKSRKRSYKEAQMNMD